MKTNAFVYIITNKTGSVLYTGVTNNLVRRIHEHRSQINDGFTKRFGVHRLVYYEPFEKIAEAIYREKMIKKKSRKAKINLIISQNPYWQDLSLDF